MKSSENTKKKKKKKSKGNSGGAQQFLVWHGEKVAMGIVAVIALWLAFQGISYMGQKMTWPPSDLENASREAREAIERSTRTVEDEDLKIIDYAAYAEQIKEPIPAEPYGVKAQWKPPGAP